MSQTPHGATHFAQAPSCRTYAPVASITTHVTFCSASMSANRKISDDVADDVVTAADVLVWPRLTIRTHTFASVFETASSTPRTRTDGGLGRESGNS